MSSDAINGTVTRLLYSNDESGWCAVRLNNDERGNFAATGPLLGVREGDELRLTGQLGRAPTLRRAVRGRILCPGRPVDAGRDPQVPRHRSRQGHRPDHGGENRRCLRARQPRDHGPRAPAAARDPRHRPGDPGQGPGLLGETPRDPTDHGLSHRPRHRARRRRQGLRQVRRRRGRCRSRRSLPTRRRRLRRRLPNRRSHRPAHRHPGRLTSTSPGGTALRPFRSLGGRARFPASIATPRSSIGPARDRPDPPRAGAR